MGESIKHLFSNWFSTDNFQAWKLQTTWDYIFFGILLLIGFLIFFCIYRSMKKHRNQKDATKRVARKLKRLGGKGSVCYIDKMVKTTDMEHFCELINVARDRVYVVKVFPWGTKVVGSKTEKEWAFAYGREIRYEANPLNDLDQQRGVVTRVLLRANQRSIPVIPLVVFADNFGRADFSIHGLKAANAVPIQQMGSWRRTYKLDKVPLNLEEVKAALEKSFVDVPQETASEAPAEGNIVS